MRLYGGDGCWTGYWRLVAGPGVDAFLIFAGCDAGLDDADLLLVLLLRMPLGLSSLGRPISDLLKVES